MNKISPRKNIEKLVPYEPGKPIEELQRELDIPLKDIIKLASNENPLGVSPKAKKAIRQKIDSLNRYPDGGCFYLKKKLSQKLKLSADNLIIGNGSDELIDLITKVFLEEKDEVLISEPAFAEYKIITKTRPAKIRAIPVRRKLLAKGISVFRYNLEKMLSAISKKTKVIFMGNPDNPTGAYLDKKSMDIFLRRCPERVLVVLDEAYKELIAAVDYVETAPYIRKGNVIVLRTFSKTYGLAGLRIGYGIADKRLISWLERARQPFNVNMAAQYAACAALEDKLFVKRAKDITTRGRKFIVKELVGLGFDVIKTEANFVLFSGQGLSGTELFRGLLKKGIIIRDMKSYGLKRLARVSIGTMQENKRFIAACEELFCSG